MQTQTTMHALADDFEFVRFPNGKNSRAYHESGFKYT